LDVAGGGSRDGANVQQYTCNGTSAQRWAVQAMGNGQYRLMPQTANNRCLDIDNAAPANGTNIQQWTCNSSVAQAFQLAFDTTGPQPIPNGTYRISPGTGAGRCLDVAGGSTADAGNLQQWECNGTDAQRFRFRSLGGTSYEVRASVSEMCVEVAYSGTWNGANIHQWPCGGTAAQTWSVETLGAGRYRFAPQVASGKCMDVSGGSASNGANVQQWSCNATGAQSFAVLAP
ncbi:MAG TPA: RICIN domain-containing protein, partial [Polyangiaceae bacterium]|nr:RICIN domain-containing protein [Polyangiaceae bacterium]